MGRYRPEVRNEVKRFQTQEPCLSKKLETGWGERDEDRKGGCTQKSDRGGE